jgi:hypothetical protein
MDNITIGGEWCNITDNIITTPADCDGTPTACASYGVQSDCENASCNWGAGGSEWITYNFTSFETNTFEGWTDGGPDAVIVSDKGSCGTHSVKLDDDSGDGNILGDFDWDGNTTVRLEFDFASEAAIDENECLELRCDGVIVDSWGTDSDLDTCGHNVPEDGNWYPQEVVLGGSNCTLDSVIRIMFISDSSGNGEDFWVDCINFSVYTAVPSTCSGTPDNCDTYDDDLSGDNCTDFGCDWTAQSKEYNQEFSYSDDAWRVNCTIPCCTGGSAFTGLQDLFLNATYDGNTYNETETNAIDYGSVGDTCSCPASGDWNIDCSDNCVIETDCNMQGNDVIMTGNGLVNIQALIHNYGKWGIHKPCQWACHSQTGCWRR